MKAPSSFVTNTIELISSADRPFAINRDRPTLDCKAQNRNRPSGSQSNAKFTALLQRLQTPSNSITGRRSFRKTLNETILGSSSKRRLLFPIFSLSVVEFVVMVSLDDDALSC